MSRSEDKDSANTESEGISLGLGDLLSGLSDSAVTQKISGSEKLSTSTKGKGTENPLDSTGSALEFQLQELFSSCDWIALEALSQSKMEAADLEASLAKAWWLVSQLKLERMPIAILSAPYEALLDEMERRWILDAEPTRYSKSFETVLTLLQNEILASLRSDEKEDALVVDLERRFALATKALGISEHRPSNKPLEVSRAKDRQFVIDEGVGKASDLSANDISKVVGLSKAKNRNSTKSKGFVLILLACIVLIAYKFIFATADVVDVLPNLRLKNLSSFYANVHLPDLGPLKVDSKLAALFYDLEAKETRAPSPNPSVASMPESRQAKQKEARAVKNSTTLESKAPSAKVVSRNKKEKLDLSGPVASAKLPKEVVEKEEAADKSVVALGPYDRQDQEVKFYKPEKFYRILVRTEVMAQPSFMTSRVGYLSAGDRVLVEARMGPWLRIRSGAGRMGYVLAQDAEDLGITKR